MYSHEIQKYVEDRNRQLTPLEFMAIINTSPQIKQVDLAPNSANYTIKTEDGFNININIIEEPPVKKKILKNN